MKRKTELFHLQQIARACLDRDLAGLKEATNRRETLLGHLTGLEPTRTTTLDPVTAARIAATHQIWADARRAEINMALARSTAEWLEKQSEARQSFGRWQVLHALSDRNGPRR